MDPVRSTGKRALERAMVGAGLDRLGCRLRHGRATVLAYHNVVPDSAPPTGESALHLPLRVFARQLDAICRLGRVLPLEKVLALAGAEYPPGRIFAITFDDAYRGAVTLAVRELARRELPATIFVAPALLGDRTFWWDALLGDTDLDMESLRNRILTETDGTLETAQRVAADSGLKMKPMPEYSRSATEAELEEAARADGTITIGSHSWSHASLVRLSGSALADEVIRPRVWLHKRFGSRYLDVLAYPYGFHSASVRRAVSEAGYRAGFGLVRGSIPVGNAPRSRDESFDMPRLNVPAGLSEYGLRIRAAWS